jgi:transposase InsO family protein
VVSLAAKRAAATFLEQAHAVSERRACRVLSVHRSTKRRQPGQEKKVALVARIHALSERYPRFGYRKIFALLKAEQWHVSRETVRRLRKCEGLQVVKKGRKRRPVGTSTTPPTRAAHPNHVWSYDFVHDETTDGRRLKCLTVIDEYTREGLAISCARSITAEDVVQVLQRLFAQHGAPVYVKSDNGPEFIAQRVTTWLHTQHVDTHFIDPGSPWQNGHNESFNGVFRDGCLNRWLFTSVQEARCIITNWLEEYNHERPHGALEGLTPHAFAMQCSGQALESAA